MGRVFEAFAGGFLLLWAVLWCFADDSEVAAASPGTETQRNGSGKRKLSRTETVARRIVPPLLGFWLGSVLLIDAVHGSVPNFAVRPLVALFGSALGTLALAGALSLGYVALSGRLADPRHSNVFDFSKPAAEALTQFLWRLLPRKLGAALAALACLGTAVIVFIDTIQYVLTGNVEHTNLPHPVSTAIETFEVIALALVALLLLLMLFSAGAAGDAGGVLAVLGVSVVYTLVVAGAYALGWMDEQVEAAEKLLTAIGLDVGLVRTVFLRNQPLGDDHRGAW